MTTRHHYAGLSVVTLVALAAACGQGGNVPRYAPCAATSDTCPSSTVCEAATNSSAVSDSPTFCTHSCKVSTDCPNDPTGIAGACAFAIDPDCPNPPCETEDSFGFCFEVCTGPCPVGETCTSAQVPDMGSNTTVCVPETG
jgi:hypothetical protein